MTKPRAGSRPYALANMQPGSALVFEAKPGRSQALMQQLGVDIGRVAVRADYRVSLLLAIEPRTRAVFELVRVERIKTA